MVLFLEGDNLLSHISYRLRHSQMYEASVLKYGDLSQGKVSSSFVLGAVLSAFGCPAFWVRVPVIVSSSCR